MADESESETLANRAESYREFAAFIRGRAASAKTSAARDALAMVADGYELLACYAESLERTGATPCCDEQTSDAIIGRHSSSGRMLSNNPQAVPQS